ncbi:ribosomal protein S5 domain 2-like protein [Cutaneotrichosporon oleaginosum]|uniref:Ribosomal protein S5 domain 2-like protein n=1 Tax=Cutaneotrichosporon oleaginosum TaxID=879819 RepID=A0A0J0XYJ5_9TREE|nr:ribosomal protein S5 domain 2-like protein [Cutaneotrichosporon oleaginosum]KLT46125.1 ribosomal protein S5 domain 2-like protein [Cutaneotrichosporon oleaginosum]TXT10137.1 hypothetical protein COLE_04071 [Cutaneotrichosporon oleaginosum]
MSAPRSLLAARAALRPAAAVASPAPLAALSLAGSSRLASTYTPGRTFERKRPPRPRQSTYFTAKADLTAALLSLHATRVQAEERLRAELVWPIPKGLPHLDAPPTAWKSRDNMRMVMRANRDYDNLVSLLSKMHHMAHVASTCGVHDVAARLQAAVEPYQRSERVADLAARAAAKSARGADHGIDAFGRAYALGRRKSSSARVWVVPSQAARTLAEVKEGEEAAVSAPTSEILVNHLPLPEHFVKVADREAVLRPLRVTGLLGAFNIFASVRGGGSTGQSGAIAHAVAQAVTLLRPDAHDALFNDGALGRDPRVVERKKTNRPKARKGYTWVKR